MPVNYDPFSGVREFESRYSPTEDMVSAFIRACKGHKNPVFGRSLNSWVRLRSKARLAVDPLDPEAETPSEEFKQSLRKAFDATFPKKATKRAVEKAATKKRR
jgi:hypothetical protein